MRQRKSVNYLVIASAHLGVSPDILAIYSKVAAFYKAKVIHLGPLATDEEMARYKRLNAARERLADAVRNASTERQEEIATEKLERVASEVEDLKYAQNMRVAELDDAFGKVTYVTTDDMVIPGKIDGQVVRGGMELSRYLFLSPIPPRTMRASGGITQASVTYLTELGKSWIVAHPVPETQVFPKPGLNEAYNYFTVGALKHASIPTHTKNQYQFAHMPCAILVIMDKENGEFHPTQLHIDYLRDEAGNKTASMVLHDGLLFTSGTAAPLEVPEDDRASFGTDYHARWQHPGVVGCHRTLNTLFRPGTLIDGGDMGSFESVSHWLEGKPGDSEGLRLNDDLLGVRALMDALANVSSIKRKVLIDSNHHEWLTDYVAKNKALKGLLDWPTLARDMFKDWEIIIREAGDNKIFKFGDLTIRHGDKDGGVRGRFKNVKYLCGHFHRFVTWRRAIGLGCGAKLGPKYTGNDVNAWQSQIASITRHMGVTAVAPKIVLHDKSAQVSRFAYRNSIIEVDAYHIKV